MINIKFKKPRDICQRYQYTMPSKKAIAITLTEALNAPVGSKALNNIGSGYLRGS
jgi:hypothetical protein